MNRKKQSSRIFQGDARDLDSYIEDNSIDLTITSPPYFDMKDYGVNEQIGFGQTYENYLEDLRVVFRKLFFATKSTGTLWVIIDSFKRDGEVVPLPFDFANRIRQDGWKLKDIIVWKKDKTVPWSGKGSTRKIFEYVLFFSKTDDYKYYPDSVRSSLDLKRWWVKYPERYNPKGKSLEEIWEFGIPTQGSWGKSYIKHFCPLPVGLVQRIISLCSDPGDTIFDPFSGTGTVPAQAFLSKRKYFGIEINPEYISMFSDYIKNVKIKKDEDPIDGEFYENIINLRILKYARVLAKNIIDSEYGCQRIYVKKSFAPKDGKEKNIVAFADYYILSFSEIGKVEAIIKEKIAKPPLSKFGVKPNFFVFDSEKEFYASLRKEEAYCYTVNNTNNSIGEVALSSKIDDDAKIISNIKVNIKE